MYIVAFNGPPQCGKDTLASLVADVLDEEGSAVSVQLESLSYPIRKIAYAMTGSEDLGLEGPDYEEFKTTHHFPYGVTGRQLMIDISERFLKPVYGEFVFPRLLMKRAEANLVLVRDAGFQAEVNYLSHRLYRGCLHVVQVTREGYTFQGDSRQYVRHTHETEIENSGTLEALKIQAKFLIGQLRALGWKL